MSQELVGRLPQVAFDEVISLLATAPSFQKKFEADPVRAIKERGIRLAPSQEAALRRIIPLLDIPDQETFDERLVLCSSSGY